MDRNRMIPFFMSDILSNRIRVRIRVRIVRIRVRTGLVRILYKTMGLSPIAIPFIVMTGFWGIIGLIVPWFIPKGPNRGITQVVLVETAVACYLFWICTYLMQLNPLIGPQLANETIFIIQNEWGQN